MRVDEFRANKELMKEFKKFRSSAFGKAVISVIETDCLRPSLPSDSANCNQQTCALALGEYAGSWKVFDILDQMTVQIAVQPIIEETYQKQEQE